jgi:hypothetical protein
MMAGRPWRHGRIRCGWSRWSNPRAEGLVERRSSTEHQEDVSRSGVFQSLQPPHTRIYLLNLC